MLDLTGGFLSLAQLVLDSSLQNDWSGLTGNPVKFFLSQITIVFDAVFITQHYVMYPDREVAEDVEAGAAASETSPLLTGEEEREDAVKIAGTEERV